MSSNHIQIVETCPLHYWIALDRRLSVYIAHTSLIQRNENNAKTNIAAEIV